MKQSESQDDKISQGFAFAELVEFIEEHRLKNEGPLRLADVTSLYISCLKQYGIDQKPQSTRLKNRLLGAIPGLQACTFGKEVLLAFTDQVGHALKSTYTDSRDEEALCLAKTARLVRRDIFNHKSQPFNGTMDQKKSIPESLLVLMSMLLTGPIITCDNKAKTQAALSIAQLVKFNCVKRCGSRKKTIHTQEQETPLPLYMGLKIHAQTRSRSLIDSFYKLGISVSYDRVLQVSTELTDTANAYFSEIQAVVPNNLRKGIVCTSAIDNIDHNPSSLTSHGSFHGTGISIFQHPSKDNKGTPCLPQLPIVQATGKKSVSELPNFYANVPPALLEKTALVPPLVNDVQAIGDDSFNRLKDEEIRWLMHIKESVMQETLPADVSWGVWHSLNQTESSGRLPSITSLLPLFSEQAKSVAMIKHGMNMVCRATEFLNPGQTCVLAADQPLFSVAKEVQWKSPEQHGEASFVIMLGGLHIEMAYLKVLGQWLEGSGWVESIVEARTAGPGTANSFLKAVHVTRTRRAHEITVCALQILLDKSYQAYLNDVPVGNESLSKTSWYSKRTENYPTFKFWAMVLEMELILLMLIRSLREGNFDLYLQSMVQMGPWFFALDHQNYSRWLPIHIRDMAALQVTHPDILQQFKEGKFVIWKTGNKFSAILIDQAHRFRPLSDPIKRNKFQTISMPRVKARSTVLTQVSSLKQDCNLFARLYIASQSREGSLDDFFSHENHSYPSALSQHGKMHLANKSVLLNCLEDLAVPKDTAPEVNAILLDGAAIAHFLSPGVSRTFSDYATYVFIPFIKRTLASCRRLDLVWGVYREDSLKNDARDIRGSGSRRRVAPEKMVPQNWSDFLKNSMNKTELFQFLSSSILSIEVEELIIVTSEDMALTIKVDYEAINEISPCSHEEADSRLMLHSANAVSNGFAKIMIRTVDTDVVVLAAAHFSNIKSQEMWIDFGTGKTRQYIPIHELVEALGPEKCRGLLIFHSITGCDTVSAMFGIGKKKAWQLWQTYDQITKTFVNLSLASSTEISDAEFNDLEHIVVLLYDKATDMTSVNDVRRMLFTQKGRSIENTPPTQAALQQHIRRAVYQGGHV